MTSDQVLYVYRCAACGRRGERHSDDDSRDGEPAVCDVCGASVKLEWDGGVTLHQKPPAALDVIADRVLAYRPKPKSKPAKKRASRQKKIEQQQS